MAPRARHVSSPSAHKRRASASSEEHGFNILDAPGTSPFPPSARLLKPQTMLQLQRTLGNRAVLHMLTAGGIQRQVIAGNLVLQRKPADINGAYEINYDITKDKKKHINNAAGRAKGPTRTKAINAQAKEKWVTPNDQLIGGHLFGAQFGGPDNETNVVPWSKTQEDAFSEFEEEFTSRALSDARKAVDKKLTLKVATAATFADRPDLKATDDELTTAGWGPTDAGRKERKDKLDEVAENFSGIPKSVKVKVTGLSTGEQGFEPSPASIAPAYKRNEDALKPAFVPYKRYQRNATEPRVLNMVPDWTAKRGELFKNPLVQKLQHVGDRHGDQLGAEKNGEPANLKVLEAEFKKHVDDTAGTEQILGTYLGSDVTHYVKAATKYWLCVDMSGNLMAAFILSQTQYDNLIARGTVG